MFFNLEEWEWPLDNAVQASVLEGLLRQEGIPSKVVRHGEALWGYAEQASEGWGHLEAPDEYKDEVNELYHDFLESEK